MTGPNGSLEILLHRRRGCMKRCSRPDASIRSVAAVSSWSRMPRVARHGVRPFVERACVALRTAITARCSERKTMNSPRRAEPSIILNWWVTSGSVDVSTPERVEVGAARRVGRGRASANWDPR